MRVALLTDRERTLLTHDDRRLVPTFAEVGIEAAPAVWDDPAIAWADFDAVIIRSPWDYHQRFPAFDAFLDRCAADGVNLINPVDLVRWNTRKAYLQELAARGAPVPPTWRFLAGTQDLSEWIARWGTLVVKPEVAGGGKDTWRVDAGNQAEIEALLRARDGVSFLAQPYLAAIERVGELSLIFFDRMFSHAVRKRAAAGGFLIHEEHGGSLRRAFPDRAVVDEARAVLSLIDGPLPYARVDLVEDGERSWLIELELIEPELFFRFDRGSARRFVEAIQRHLARSPR